MAGSHTRIIDCRVTKALVEQATKKNSQHCMVADAVKAAVDDAQHVMVDLATIRFTDPKRGKRYVYLTPKIAQQRLVDFDQGRPIEPFGFRLYLAHFTNSSRTRDGKRTEKRGHKRLRADGVIEGGKPPVTAHLSNITLKSGGLQKREYGLRQLKP